MTGTKGLKSATNAESHMEWRFCFGNDFLKQICPRPASFAERTTRPLDVRELAAKASPCLRKVRFGCRNRFFLQALGQSTQIHCHLHLSILCWKHMEIISLCHLLESLVCLC